MAWLNPIVHILFTFSATLGGIGLPWSPATTIFTGMGVLLGAARDVIASYETLFNLFERIQFFLQRLNDYQGVPLTSNMVELLGKIMAQVLSIVALSTKTMRERRITRFLKKLLGRKDVEDALARLDVLTKEEDLMVAARTLNVVHNIDGNVKDAIELTRHVDRGVAAIKDDIGNVSSNVKANTELIHHVDAGLRGVSDDVKGMKCDAKAAIETQERNQLREKLRTWLNPPNPSINHTIACDKHHNGTARWFIQGRTFKQWKANGSLLWIRGNPGAGKSILCSAIIEDIKQIHEPGPPLVGYYYFDFRDALKRDVRGLLTSVLMQLCDASDSCSHILSRLYTKHKSGSEHPSDAALTQCLKIMLDLPRQVPIYLIVDAMDECPNDTGTPSAREKVLDFVEDLVQSRHSNLFICITSRPEQDINTILGPLTSPSTRVSLHEEVGQTEDINSYIRCFVRSDREMRRWRMEDKERVINALTERANGMFRWVYCQLDNLRRCMPSSIRKALDELPITLDETYERILQGIPKQKRQHAHQLFQCIVAAIRPLRVEELAELFAIEFGANTAPKLLETWRPEHPEEAVLSTCSTLIAVIDDEGSKIVQFSHFSVKEFLTSGRLEASEVGSIRDYYIPLEPAHTTLARACLTVLLQFDENMDKRRLAMFPLAFYAAEHWVDHAKFGDVSSQIVDVMEDFFDPRKPYLTAWTWLHDVGLGDKRSIGNLRERPSPPGATPLYYLALCGFYELAKRRITGYSEDLNTDGGVWGTPLHAASLRGHADVARVLLDHGANANARNVFGESPLYVAHVGNHFDVMKLLLERGAHADAQGDSLGTALHEAAYDGHTEVAQLLLRHGANVDARGNMNRTPLFFASSHGHRDIVQLLLDHRAEVDPESVIHETPLWAASDKGHLEIVRLLLDHGADVHFRKNRGQTAFQRATLNGHHDVAQLLLEHGAVRE
ncbi:hypothetical protein BC826DRAFT_956018 [Russula brevipes]|nr:hypothetical protein BC826DRAFT_956018 [Russula brevipes]